MIGWLGLNISVIIIILNVISILHDKSTPTLHNHTESILHDKGTPTQHSKMTNLSNENTTVNSTEAPPEQETIAPYFDLKMLLQKLCSAVSCVKSTESGDSWTVSRLFFLIYPSMIIMSIVLLIGVHTANQDLIEIWLRVNIIAWIFAVDVYLINIVIVSDHFYKTDMEWTKVLWVYAAIGLGLYFYCIIIVKSYWAMEEATPSNERRKSKIDVEVYDDGKQRVS